MVSLQFEKREGEVWSKRKKDRKLQGVQSKGGEQCTTNNII